MLKVQVELIQFQKKASEYYQNLKKDEKLKNLETSISWLKNESVRLAENIERLTDEKKEISDKLKDSQEETKSWRA
jgi:predicted  nucleic acid-binding Zn-ribbon protein